MGAPKVCCTVSCSLGTPEEVHDEAICTQHNTGQYEVQCVGIYVPSSTLPQMPTSEANWDRLSPEDQATVHEMQEVMKKAVYVKKLACADFTTKVRDISVKSQPRQNHTSEHYTGNLNIPQVSCRSL